MAKTRSALTLGCAFALAATAMFACSDDAGDKLGARSGTRGGASSGSSGDGTVDPNDPNNPENVPEEQKKFVELQAEFDMKCGNACHNQGTYRPEPPKFLAGSTPVEVYKTIKAHPGIVTRDVYQSALLTKPAHAGPALNTDAELETKIVAWLEAESFAIQSQKLPSTEPTTVNAGPNEIDLTPASGGKLTGVKLTFEASLVGSMLTLSKLALVVPAGTDVHLQQPKFIRVLAQPKADGTSEVADPADSFSNLDTTVAQGTTGPLGQGTVFFSGDGWKPYDLAGDKIRIEAVKLEPGKVQVIAQAATCKNVANFTANVLPFLRGGNGITPNCAGCHGNGLAGLALNAANNQQGQALLDAQTLVCNQVLSKMTAPPNLAQSLLLQKATNPNVAHSGNKVNDAAAFSAAITDNAAVFF
jgi:hypothetical protein